MLKQSTTARLVLTGAGLLALSTLCNVSASAQTPNLPGSADPSRLQERLLLPPPQDQQAIIPPKELVIDKSISDAIDGFILNDVTLQGVTVFKADYFDDLIAEYIGRSVDINTLNHLAARITKTYRDAGYFLARAVIAQQEVTNGNIIIQIIEGQIGAVTIDDPQNLLSKDHGQLVTQTIKAIKNLKPLHGPSLERYILLLNDHSGINIQNILQPPTQISMLGTVDITLRVQVKKRSSLSASYDNYGSRFVGPHQFGASYNPGGVFNAFDQLNIQASSVIPVSELQFIAMRYSLPLNAEGLTASLSANYSNSEPGLALKDLELEGDSAGLSATLFYPVIRSRAENLKVGTSFSLLNSASEFLDEELIDDKIRSFSIFAEYNTQDKWAGQNYANLSLYKGLDILDATKTGSGSLSRQQGRSDFFKAHITATRAQNLSPSFQIQNSVSAQYAPHPLLSSEEFGYGGVSFGRAYDPSEITGDQGASTAIEILYTDLQTIPDLDLKLVPFAYYDIGKVWNEDQGAKPQSAASAGLGAYYNLNDKLSGSVQFAYPLTKPVSTPIMNGKDGPRILFGLNAGF